MRIGPFKAVPSRLVALVLVVIGLLIGSALVVAQLLVADSNSPATSASNLITDPPQTTEPETKPLTSLTPSAPAPTPKATPAPKSPPPAPSQTHYSDPPACQKIVVQQSPGLTIPQLTAQTETYKEDVMNHYYNVYGATNFQLQVQLNQCGPAEPGTNITYHAYTLTWVQYYYWTGNSSGGCVVTRYVTHLNTDFFLPRWGNPSVSPQESGISTRINNYLQSLTVHENGHRQNAVSTTQAIASYIAGFGPRPTCSQLSSELETHVNQLLEELPAKDTQYDATTQHGHTQLIHPNIYD